MMDVRRRPWLMMAAGHGGFGTLGCIDQLKDEQRISRLVGASWNPKLTNLPDRPAARDRLFAVVTVDRTAEDEAFDLDKSKMTSRRIAFATLREREAESEAPGN